MACHGIDPELAGCLSRIGGDAVDDGGGGGEGAGASGPVHATPTVDARITPSDGRNRVCLLWRSGSRAYGIDVTGSDTDIRGATMPTLTQLLLQQEHGTIRYEERDVALWPFAHLARQLRAMNPNVIEVLGLRPRDLLFHDGYADELLSHADEFISNRAIETYRGYAHSEAKLIERMLAAGDWRHAAKAQGHYIRLMRMGAEMLETGRVNTYREHDREELLAIRNGAYLQPAGAGHGGLHATADWAPLMRRETERFEKAAGRTRLHDQIGLDDLNRIIRGITGDWLRNGLLGTGTVD